MHRIFRTVIAASVLLTAVTGASGADEGGAEPVDFARDILPILSNKCFVCHGPDGTEMEVLRLDSFAHATRDLGGHRAIDPQSPEKSAVLVRIFNEEEPMPPADAEKQLTAEERTLLARWIREGGKYATHWSFVVPEKLPPAGSESAPKEAMIDVFVGGRLQAKGLEFAPEADRATLARRAALVLIGLPPQPDQLAKFMADDRADAYERYVDELLASPHFGEHQARYWLDAVRYGDTHGLHLDNRRGIYPYRDWVVHALNKNLPLDDFITWQLAGDLLPHPTLEQRVATGFVRMNPTTAEGGVIPAEFQAKNNFDRVETLGTVLLGLSLTCARCHNHKYDPVSQEEYYRLVAFFNSTAEHSLDGNKYDYAPVLKAPSSVTAWNEWDRLASESQALFSKVEPTAGDEDAPVEVRLQRIAEDKSSGIAPEIRDQATKLLARQAELEKSYEITLVAEELAQPRTTQLLQRGEYDLPQGDPLQPGTLAILGAFPADAPRNRLGLARWLTGREQPLTARVLVNRLWQQTFGEGLVRTPEEFGLQGQQPTHPQLLDWLAVELQESRWNLKQMLRLMVTSRTFRQHSAWRKGIDDPENRQLARGPRFRLDAEVIRDVGLWASDLLDPHMGSEGIKPYQPEGLWSALMHPASNTKDYVQDTGSKLYRRSLYVYWKRTCPHPMLTLFDAPSRESSCVRRSRTNTPLQSLGLLNETQRIEMARMLGERLLRASPDEAERMNQLFLLLACRTPSDGERAVCTSLLETMRKRYADAPDDARKLLSIGEAPRDGQLDITEHAAWTQVAVTLLASDLAILVY
jgi:hypothetical protein